MARPGKIHIQLINAIYRLVHRYIIIYNEVHSYKTINSVFAGLKIIKINMIDGYNMVTYWYSKTMTRTMFLFLLYCALLTTFVFSGKDAAANSCTTACNSKATKDCGCSKTSRTNSHTKETSKDHEKFKWTEPHPTEQDHGLQYGLMVLLQGGEFVMGTNNPKIVSDGEGPARRVKLNAFYMDQYEVCNHDFEMFVNKTGYITEVSIRAIAKRRKQGGGVVSR